MPPVLSVASGTVATVNVSETFTGPEKVVFAIVDTLAGCGSVVSASVCRDSLSEPVYPVTQIAGGYHDFSTNKKAPEGG